MLGTVSLGLWYILLNKVVKQVRNLPSLYSPKMYHGSMWALEAGKEDISLWSLWSLYRRKREKRKGGEKRLLWSKYIVPLCGSWQSPDHTPLSTGPPVCDREVINALSKHSFQSLFSREIESKNRFTKEQRRVGNSITIKLRLILIA